MSCEAGFSLGILCVRYYGIVLMLGALAGGYLASLEVKRRGHDPEIVWDLLVYLIIGGVLGARLWHILTPPPSSVAQGITTQYYLTHPLDALAIWKGGLGIPGTILGGLVALYLYARRHTGISFLEWTDIAAPGLALGQAIGRWGNFFNQEIYGAPTNLPWKIFIDPAHRLAGYENESYYHPLFAYESILNLANMLLLLWVTRRYRGRLKDGDVFNIYCIFYPMVRFGLDFLRLDASQVLSININQTIMAVVAVGAAAILIWRHRGGEASRPSTGSPEREMSSLGASRPAAGRTSGRATLKSSARKRTAGKKLTSRPRKVIRRGGTKSSSSS
ncbi:MAG TPA: prolipoprotein diacylglyceryl transferase [Anaerolineales bacterium]|nr:prolipoprotein diacylglyceryl transferase [Anaerolineales bacterium]